MRGGESGNEIWTDLKDGVWEGERERGKKAKGERGNDSELERDRESVCERGREIGEKTIFRSLPSHTPSSPPADVFLSTRPSRPNLKGCVCVYAYTHRMRQCVARTRRKHSLCFWFLWLHLCAHFKRCFAVLGRPDEFFKGT
jgi:hypothetical protein